MSWVIVRLMMQDGQHLWTVGHYEMENGTTRFISLEDFQTKSEAMECVHYLNGGPSRE